MSIQSREQHDIETDLQEVQQDFELTFLGTAGVGALTGLAAVVEHATGNEVASSFASGLGALSMLGIGRMVYDEVKLSGLRQRLNNFKS